MARTAHPDSIAELRCELYVALELSKDCWKLAFTTGRVGKPRIRDVRARDQRAFLEEVRTAKEWYGLAPDAPVLSCYEAGRDGFWIHRFLQAHGITNLVVDPASIEVDRRSRRVKTDRIDAQKLVRLLARHGDGEEALRVVRVPPLEAEDERLVSRQLLTLKHMRTRIGNQIRAYLCLHGVLLDPRRGSFAGQEFLSELEEARQWDGSPLPPELVGVVRMDWEQFALVNRQIKDLERRHRKLIREAETQGTEAHRKAAKLTRLKGIGDVGSLILVLELFAWRDFENRKELAALAGLTGTPHQSGKSGKDQGISKAGNPRVRRLMVELAWLWLRWQPHSRTTRWFHEHVGKAGSRAKRKAIVAVARKLLIELWHFAEHDVIPEGAVLKERTGAAA